jgi:hypothetical protein
MAWISLLWNQSKKKIKQFKAFFKNLSLQISENPSTLKNCSITNFPQNADAGGIRK